MTDPIQDAALALVVAIEDAARAQHAETVSLLNQIISMLSLPAAAMQITIGPPTTKQLSAVVTVGVAFDKPT